MPCTDSSLFSHLTACITHITPGTSRARILCITHILRYCTYLSDMHLAYCLTVLLALLHYAARILLTQSLCCMCITHNYNASRIYSVCITHNNVCFSHILTQSLCPRHASTAHALHSHISCPTLLGTLPGSSRSACVGTPVVPQACA